MESFTLRQAIPANPGGLLPRDCVLSHVFLAFQNLLGASMQGGDRVLPQAPANRSG